MSTNQIDFIKQKINFTRVQRTTVNRKIDPFYSKPKRKLTCLYMWVILGFWAIIIEKSVCRENYGSYTDYIARQTIHFKRQHVLEVTTTKTTVSFRGRKTIYFALQESHTWIEFLLFCYLPLRNILDVPV